MWRSQSVAGGLAWSDYATAMLVGTRFDVSTACFAIAPLAVLIYLPGIVPSETRRGRRIAWAYIMSVIGLGSYLLLAEFEFFREFQLRYNRLTLQYLDQPATVLAMIWNGYPVIRYTVVWLCIVLVAAFVIRWWIRITYGSQRPGTLTRRIFCYEGTTIGAIVLLLVIGIRGGLQHEPLRWGDAFKSNSDAINQFSLNGLYCLGRTMYDEAFRNNASDFWLDRMSAAMAHEEARELVLDDDDRLVTPGTSTVLRHANDQSERWLRLREGVDRPNVVLVLMESFSARMSGAISGGYEGQSYTPNFDRISGEGILFTRAFSVGTHTHQGVFGTLLGFPNLPGYEAMMQSSVGNQQFLSLPLLLKENGYHTMFLYNGDFAWDNMRGFFQKQGIERFIGRDDFPDFAATDEVWGVNDHELFMRANDEFEAAARRGPFFGVILSLSNHSPFLLPDPLPVPPVTGHGELDTRLTAVRYADWALGQFVDEARKRDYARNTVFVFVGDHGFSLDPKLTAANLLFHHVGMLVLGPGVLATPPGRQDFAVSQLNIAPTLTGLLDLNAAHAFWGRDVGTEDGRRLNHAIFKSSSGDNVLAVVQGDKVVVLDSRSKAKLFRFDLGPNPTVDELGGVDDLALRAELSEDLQGFVQAALTDLRRMRAGR